MKTTFNHFTSNKLTFLFGFVLFFLHYIAFAADPIEGKIVDAKNNKPLANVHINILGKNISTVTDINGNFSISLPDTYNEDKLYIYSKGYQPKMYKIADLKKNNTKSSPLVPQDEILFEMQPVSSSIINEDSPKYNRYNIGAGWIY